MRADPTQIVVTTGATAHASQARHRGFPDMHVDGESPGIAAENLIGHLARGLDNVATEEARAPIRRAIQDARAFVAQAAATKAKGPDETGFWVSRLGTGEIAR